MDEQADEMARGWIHTLYRPLTGDWANMVEGHARAVSVHRTQDEAIAAGRELATESRTDHLVHQADGTLASRETYQSNQSRPLDSRN